MCKIPVSANEVAAQLPKPDVAGSNPVSRSIFSTTWENFFNGLLQNCSIYMGPNAVSNAFHCVTALLQ